VPLFPTSTDLQKLFEDSDSTLKTPQVSSGAMTMLLSVISLLVSQGIAQQVQNPSQGLTVMMLSSTSTCTSISVRAVATVEIQGNSLSGSGVINLNQMVNSGVINLISAAKSEEYPSSVVVDLTSMLSYGFHPTWNASLRGTASMITSSCAFTNVSSVSTHNFDSSLVFNSNLPPRLSQSSIISADVSIFTGSGLLLRSSLSHSRLLLTVSLQIAIIKFF